MRKLFFAVAAAASLLLSAPAVAEQASAETIAASIPIGATKQDMEKHYGSPTDVSLSEEGNEIWTYDIKEVRVKHEDGLLSDLGITDGTNEAVDKSDRAFRVWFDQNGKVMAVKALN